MKTRTAILMVFSLVLFAAKPGCEIEPENVTIIVYGQGANFTGEYMLDGGSEASYFQGAESSSAVFKYSSMVGIEQSILVNIFPEPSDDADDDNNETDMTDVTLRVLDEDGDIVYESSYTVSSTLMKTFEFDLDEQVVEEPYEDE